MVDYFFVSFVPFVVQAIRIRMGRESAHPDMERLSSRVIIRLFWFWTTYFFAPRQRMCGRFPVVGEGAGCDAGSIPAGAALHQRAGRQASGSRPILPGSSAKDIPSHWPSTAWAIGE